ncbi:MAG: tetratricopeptide repeat protein [Bacteroidales bacterium]
MENRHMKAIWMIIGTLFLFSSPVCASILETKVAQANTFYTAAKYDSALVNYQQVVDAGYESSALYFNLGNTYFKLKDIPSAILYFEKARKLDPTDEEILRNLEVANRMIVDKIDNLPQFFFKSWWDTFYNLFNADTWAWISIVTFILTLIAAYFYLTSPYLWVRKTGFFFGLLLLFFTVGSFGLASQRYYYTKQISEAIIFAPTITIKSSPGSSSVDLFVLHEGTKVVLVDEFNGWHKIKIGNGSVGWLPGDSFKGI